MKTEQLRKLLDSAFWPETLSTSVTYERAHDDHDGTFEGRLMVQIDQMGDVWFATENQPPLRFRTECGGGASLRTRNALLILAEAIRLDNEERPQERLSAH